jgi:hypothetical protein
MRALPLLVVLVLFAGCHKAKGAGGGCITDVDCAGSLRCYTITAFGSRRCLASCDPAATVLCTEDAQGSEGLCAPLDVADAGPPGGVCLVGGELPLGAVCAASVDCVVGSVCVEEGTEGACRVACDASAAESACGPGRACQPLGGGRGYCVDAADGGA